VAAFILCSQSVSCICRMFFSHGRINEVTRTLGMPSFTSFTLSRPFAPYMFRHFWNILILYPDSNDCQ
jgi:hypothetical protein